MRYLLISIFVFLSTIGIAQELNVDWGVCFGDGGENSFSNSIETLPNGNIITPIIVTTNNDAFTNYHGGSDAWVLILDNAGNILQERCFGGNGAEYFLDIKVTNENIYFIGQTNSNDGDVQSEPIGGFMNLWVVKTDLDLNIIWERQYGCLGTQDFETAKLTPEGGLILLMDFFNQGGGDVSEYYGASDIWVCEIDANGEILWEKTLGNSVPNSAKDVIINQEGNIVVLGDTYAPGGMIDCTGHGASDIWVVELDKQTQEIIWQNCYGGSELDASKTLIEDNNLYYIGGVTYSNDGDISNNHGESDAWLIEIDHTGQMIWEHCFGGTGSESFWNIFTAKNGGYFLFSRTNSRDGDVNNTHCPYANCFTSTWVVELNSDKEMIWNGTHGSYGPSYHEKNAIVRVGERDFVIAARVTDEGTQQGDVDCEPYPVNNGESAWIYRLYDTTTGVVNNYQELKGLRVYPNPANTQITFKLPLITVESKLLIKDVFGNSMAELPLFKGQTQLIWNCNPIASGVYMYQTNINGEVYRGKIVVNLP